MIVREENENGSGEMIGKSCGKAKEWGKGRKRGIHRTRRWSMWREGDLLYKFVTFLSVHSNSE